MSANFSCCGRAGSGVAFLGTATARRRAWRWHAQVGYTSMLSRLLCLLAVLIVASCDQQAMIDKFASSEDKAFASSQIQALVTRDFASIEKLADPGIAGPALHPTLEQMAGLIPPGKPRSVKLVGAHTLKSADQQQANLTYEYEYPGKWLLINVATRKTGSGVSIVGFRVQPEDQSLEDQNRFTVSGKTALQYLVLALAVVVPLITLYAFVVCIRTPFAGRKWPWLLFILAGIGSLAVNWTTGEWAVGILRVQLLGASATAPLYGPLTIAVSLPLGALVFLARRQRLR